MAVSKSFLLLFIHKVTTVISIADIGIGQIMDVGFTEYLKLPL